MEGPSRKYILDKMEEFRKNFEARPLMYAGDLQGIETVWYMLHWARNLILGREDGHLGRRAYNLVHHKYKCGNWHISSKTSWQAEQKGWDDKKASEILIKRLKEVEEIEKDMREEVDEYHFNAVLEDGIEVENAEWIGLCKEFPSFSWVAPEYWQAVAGIKKIIAEVIYEMRQRGEDVPEPYGKE